MSDVTLAMVTAAHETSGSLEGTERGRELWQSRAAMERLQWYLYQALSAATNCSVRTVIDVTLAARALEGAMCQSCSGVGPTLDSVRERDAGNMSRGADHGGEGTGSRSFGPYREPTVVDTVNALGSGPVSVRVGDGDDPALPRR